MSGSTRPPVYLHIGAAKSGTTYLQTILRHNRLALQADDVLYPRSTRTSPFQAVLDLRRLKLASYEDPNTAGAWARMVNEIKQWPGPAIVSHELFAGTRPELVAGALRDLAFADVHVVFTIRNLAATLPAAWQERVKLGGAETFTSFVSAVRSAPPAGGRTWTEAAHKFWNLQNVPAILQKWGRGLAAENVHVITVPPPGHPPGELWERFAQVIGLDPGRYEIPPEPANQSLGAVEATVLRQFNEAIGREYPWEIYEPLIKGHLATELSSRPGPAIELPEADHEWALEWTARTARRIEERGYHVVGDLNELTQAVRRPGLVPDAASLEDRLDVAISAMASLAKFVAADSDSQNPLTVRELRAQLRQTRHELARSRRALTQLPPRELIKRFLIELSTRVPWLDRTYHVYRTAGATVRRKRRHRARDQTASRITSWPVER